MKLITTLLVTFGLLHAGIFDRVDKEEQRKERLQNQEILELFRQSHSDANAVIKRGDYDKTRSYKNSIDKIESRIDGLSLGKEEKQALLSDIRKHSELVEGIGTVLQRQAPDLNLEYNKVIDGLESFNKKLAGIGLAELLKDWRALSQIKNRFVKQPDASLEKAFEQKWTSVVVTITELYLDEEIETPLFEYLEGYKAYFKKLSEAYRKVGYERVAEVKPLGYKIKLQLEMMVPGKAS